MPARIGDVLTVLSDLPNGRALAKCIVINVDDLYAVNQRICIYRSKGANSSYLKWILNRNPYFMKFDDGVTQTHILNHHIVKCQIPLPPLPEQHAIATALGDVDGLLSALDALVGKREAFKRGVMEELLSGGRRLAGFSGKWETTTFDDVMTGFSSGATPRRNRKEFYTGHIPWITSSELNYNTIHSTFEKITPQAVSETNLSNLEPGTFLIAITGLEAAGTRGSCGIVGIKSTSNQSCMALIPISTKLMVEYLFYYYSLNGDALALEYCQGTKQQSYTGKLVKRLPITLPVDLKEQRAIATVLTDLDAELSALRARRAKVAAVKAGMMEALLTGAVRLV